MKHNTVADLALQSPLKTEVSKEEILTDFDYQMINEMKKTNGLENWSDDQLKQYCLVLRTYTQVIFHVTNNSSNNYGKEKTERKLPTIVGRTFLYQNGSLKSKIHA